MSYKCPFCTILKEEEENILWQDDRVFVILSHKPIHEGHSLVVSKQHVDSYLSLPDGIAFHMIKIARDITPAVVQSVGTQSALFAINIGEDSQRSIPHAHLHIIPRSKNDGLQGWVGVKQDEEDLIVLRTRIVSLLNLS